MNKATIKILRVISVVIVAWVSMLITDNAPATTVGCCVYLILSQDL